MTASTQVSGEVQKAQDAENQKKKEKKMVSAEMKSGLLMGFGAFGVLLGAITVAFWPAIFMGQLKNMLVLTNTSQSYELWREVPIPMYLECYMFNITNVAEILNRTEGQDIKVTVEQIGPYVFREFHKKVDIEWNDNSTVTYYNERTWHFEPELSNASLTDMITSINPVTVTVGYFARNQPRVIRLAVDVFLRMSHDNIFLTANASSWLFDGIEDPVLDIAERIPDFPIAIPYDKFAWFYERNGSKEYDGIFVINTGAADFSQLGNVEMWRHSNRTMYRDECGDVRGSTGELWAPELGQPELTVFVPDICTHLNLSENRTVTVSGVPGVEYNGNYSLFDNGYRYESMACYCDEVRDENCLPPGALNVSSCRYGAPAFVSLPHFHNTDPYYPSKIDGLNPTDEHTFRLALEMYTGMPLEVRAQMQISMLVRHQSGMSMMSQLPDPDTLVPMFWFRQEMSITDEYARLARFALNVRLGVAIGLYVLTGIGVILIAIGILVLVRKLMRSPDTVPILSEASSDEDVRQ